MRLSNRRPRAPVRWPKSNAKICRPISWLFLEHLNEDQRTLLTLHDIEFYTLAELETILETPLGTLKSRLHRARARLRGLLTERFEQPVRVKGERVAQ